MPTIALVPPVDPAWEAALAFLPFVRRVACEYRHRSWDRDDLIQEGLIAVYNAALRYEPRRGSFFRLVDVAVHNRMRDWLRWRHRHRRATGDEAPAVARADRVDLADLADVLAALGLRTDRQQTIVREHFGLYGPARTEAAIAVTLGTTRDAVARCQFRGLAQIRKRLGVAP
jgi:RNA polymerase sigma factor (sigma-70 family)